MAIVLDFLVAVQFLFWHVILFCPIQIQQL